MCWAGISARVQAEAGVFLQAHIDVASGKAPADPHRVLLNTLEFLSFQACTWLATPRPQSPPQAILHPKHVSTQHRPN